MVFILPQSLTKDNLLLIKIFPENNNLSLINLLFRTQVNNFIVNLFYNFFNTFLIKNLSIMKKVFFTLTVLLFFVHTFGQKTEFRVALNSGLFSFVGPSAKGTTAIYYYTQTNTSNSNLAFGAKKALSYGLSLNIKRLTKTNILLGVDLGYEVLRSKASIDKVYEYDGTTANEYNATGQIFSDYSFLNLNPFIGYRFYLKYFSVDLTGGFDVGYCLSAMANGNATATNGKKYTTLDRERKSVSFDFRPRVQLSANYKKLGLYLGYSYGLINYLMFTKVEINVDSWRSLTRLIRFGITYKIK